jgi:hypothetical protein
MSFVRALLVLGAPLCVAADDEALVSYVGVDTAHAFLAVHAGTSRREATALRDSLRASRTYSGANVRRLVAVLHCP